MYRKRDIHYGWIDNYPEEKAKRMKGLRRSTAASDETKKSEQAGSDEAK